MSTPKTVRRAFPGLVGRPPEPDGPRSVNAVSEPTVSGTPTPSPPKGPGRPRKHESNAAKQKAHRNKKAIEEVLAIPDTHGRLHGERSGEAKRKHGTSEIETLINVRERVPIARAVKPEGQGPAAFEKDETADQSSDRNATREYVRGRLDQDLDAKKLEDKIAAIAEWAFNLSGWEGRCRLCGHGAVTTQGRQDHVWQAYEHGLRLEDAYRNEKELTESGDPVIADFAKQRVEAVRVRWVEDRHVKTINALMRKRRIS
jgi:hypothetical protein